MNNIPQVVANLEAWLETMRCPGATGRRDSRKDSHDQRDSSICPAGYGGPVVHWWANCLSYTGPGLDWRYEGIIIGYLTLWQRTGQQRWLEKACRAGDDLVKGQLPSGNFRHSRFELNPYTGGTPHEAACDLALLRLALALREIGDERWPCYAEKAERNLQEYFINRLWDEEAQSFRDHPDVSSLVPNKTCTLAEALFAWAELRRDNEPIKAYALPALGAVLALQLKSPTSLAGAIPQNTLRGEVVEAYFPYYIARCIPALLLAHKHTSDDQWLAGAISAFIFVERGLNRNGLLPQVIYTRGTNYYPQWIAPLGDILRVANLLAPYGFTFSGDAAQEALLAGQLASGGFATASGFTSQINQKSASGSLPDYRDSISVVGWNDKTFHYLVSLLPDERPLPSPDTGSVEMACQIQSRPATWQETNKEMRLFRNDGEVLYLWHKGHPWAEIVAPEVQWK